MAGRAARGGEPCARFSGLVASGLLAITHDPADLDTTGRWAVVVTYEGALTAARFAHWRSAPPEAVAGPWQGPDASDWITSLDRPAYERAVEAVRQRIGAGDVYQACVCRILSAEPPDASRADLGGLHALLTRHNPAPYEGFLKLGELQVATASPELLLQRDGDRVRTGPIKGTGRSESDLQPKDDAENVMIVDLMRNDLSRVCVPGSVHVPRLLAREHHPGLVHLVSEVAGTLLPDRGWADILGALMPPGSVSGAPKSSAVTILAEHEPEARGPYCGAIGWIDADERRAVLAVGIRTFWRDAESAVHFGTGAGITWGSVAAREWRETEWKSERLLRAASLTWPGPTAGLVGP